MNSVSKSAIVICATALLLFVMSLPATATPSAPNLSAVTDTTPAGPTPDDSLRTLQTNAETLRAEIQTSTVTDNSLVALREQAEIMAEHFAKLQASLHNSRAVLARMPNSGDKLQRLETLAAQATARHTQLQNAVSAALAEPTAANIQALLQVIGELLPPELHQPLGASLPHRSTSFDPVEPVFGAGSGLVIYGGKITLPAGIASVEAPPTDADLQPTIETAITPEIAELAAMLSHRPLAIYAWVYNNIDYEPYYGSLKGAATTLADRSGNDIDQASLLIALLRASGIHCRYAYGTIEIPIDDLMNWIGVPDPENAFKVMSTRTGIPIAPGYQGGNLAAVKIEHVWVMAWIDYLPSRGTINREGDCWIPLDASKKRYIELAGENISSRIEFNISDYLSTVTETAPAMIYYEKAMQYKNDNWSETIGTHGITDFHAIIEEDIDFLPADLDYNVINISCVYDGIPDVLKHRWRFLVGGIDKIVSIVEIGDNRVSVSYIPASPGDDAIISEYGGLYATPPYLISMKPELEIQNVLKCNGNSLTAGEKQEMIMQYIYPGSTIIESFSNSVTAGGYYGIGIVGTKVSSDVMTRSVMDFKNAFSRSQTPDTTTEGMDDEAVNEMLHLSAMKYFHRLNSCEELVAGIMHVRCNKQPSEAMFGINVKSEYSFGVPYDIYPTGLFLDVDRNIYASYSSDGNMEAVKKFYELMGYTASHFEHALFESLYQAEAVSAVKLIQLANDEQVPIFTITGSNVALVLPVLQVEDSLKYEINALAEQGLEIMIPEHELVVGNWKGVGYVIRDPVTGSGGYMISGGTAGSALIDVSFANTLWHAFGIISKFYDALAAGTKRTDCLTWGFVADAENGLELQALHVATMKQAAWYLTSDDGKRIVYAFPVYVYAAGLSDASRVTVNISNIKRLMGLVNEGVFVHWGHGRGNIAAEPRIRAWTGVDVSPGNLGGHAPAGIRCAIMLQCFSISWKGFFEDEHTSFIGFDNLTEAGELDYLLRTSDVINSWGGIIQAINSAETMRLRFARDWIQQIYKRVYESTDFHPYSPVCPNVYGGPLERLDLPLCAP